MDAAKVAAVQDSTAEVGAVQVGAAQVLRQRGAALVRVFIDKPEGVTHEDCANVSNEISVILDVEDLIPNRYTLEVSSPGLNRGLYKRADYERFAGSLVRIRIAEPIEGRRNYKGRLRGIEGDEAVIIAETGAEAGTEFRFHLSQIAKANLEPEF